MAEHSAALRRVDIAPDPSVAHAIDLAQRIAVGRLRLLQLDLEKRAQSALQRSAWIGLGGLCLLLAWLGLLGAAVAALDTRLPLQTSLLLVSLFQLLIGAGLIAWGRRLRTGR
jgi:hypothetical protein